MHNHLNTRAQQACLRILSDLIAQGAAADLPECVWTIGYTGVTGQTSTFETDGDPRETFAAWARLINAEVKESKSDDGSVHLRAGTRYPSSRIAVVFRTVLTP